MIRTLEIQNFLPFQKRQTLRFDNRGLVMVRGRNLVSEALSDNGAGKTSIVHAISWCWFGVDLHNRRADAVCNRFTDGTTTVRVVMEDALGEWSIERTRRPATLKVTGIDGVLENEDMAALQEKVEQRLGFGLHTFRNAVVFGQGTFDRYANAEQADQLRMIDEITGVDFSGEAKRAREWRSSLETQYGQVQSSLHTATTSVNLLETTLETHRQSRDRFEENRAAAVARLEVRRPELAKALDSAQAQAYQQAGLAERVKKLAARVVEVERLTQRHAEAMKGSLLLRVKAQEAKGDVENLRKDRESVTSLPSCPTCLQDVGRTAAALKRVKARFDTMIQDLESAALHAAAQSAKADEALAGVTALLEDEMADLARETPDRPPHVKPEHWVRQLQGRCTEQETRRLQAAVDAAAKAIGQLNGDIRTVQAEAWSGADALAQAESDLLDQRQKVKNLERRAEKLVEAIEISDYCVEAAGDRGIRSLLVDGVADYMNERIALHLETLAGGEAKTVMSATKPTKKGTTRERITFSTEWAWGAAGTDGSGGQDRRKDLAVFAAAQDLAESRTGRPFPVKVFDEPFDALDSRGKELACAWVRKVAHAQGTALLITHSEEIAAVVEADRVWTVVLDRDGARVEES